MTLLLVFASADSPAPSLPHISILDVDLDVPVPVAGLEGWDEDFIQTSAKQFAPMDFGSPKVDQILAGISTVYWCRRVSKILLSCAFSISGANASIRIAFEDKSENTYYGEARTLTAVAAQNDDSKYYSPIESYDSLGANKVWFIVESISAGNVDIAAAGV